MTRPTLTVGLIASSTVFAVLLVTFSACSVLLAVSAQAAAAQLFRGAYVSDFESSNFYPCGNAKTGWWIDSKNEPVITSLRLLAQKTYRERKTPLFIEFEGFKTNRIVGDLDGEILLTRLISAQALRNDIDQCDLDSGQLRSLE